MGFVPKDTTRTNRSYSEYLNDRRASTPLGPPAGVRRGRPPRALAAYGAVTRIVSFPPATARSMATSARPASPLAAR